MKLMRGAGICLIIEDIEAAVKGSQVTISTRDAHQRTLVILLGRLQYWMMDGALNNLPAAVALP